MHPDIFNARLPAQSYTGLQRAWSRRERGRLRVSSERRWRDIPWEGKFDRWVGVVLPTLARWLVILPMSLSSIRFHPISASVWCSPILQSCGDKTTCIEESFLTWTWAISRSASLATLCGDRIDGWMENESPLLSCAESFISIACVLAVAME